MLIDLVNFLIVVLFMQLFCMAFDDIKLDAN